MDTSRMDFWLTTFTLFAFGYGCWLWFRNTFLNRADARADMIIPPVKAVTVRALPWAAWIGQAQQAAHLLLVGETGSGKSTLALALIAYCQPAQLCIIDPHAGPSDWQGLAVVGSGRDYPAIDAALGALRTELQQRYEDRRNGVTTYPALWIVIDEVPAIAANCPAWPPFLHSIAAEGRKVGMLLCVLSQSPLVEALGVKGRGDTRSAFVKVLLGAFATASGAQGLTTKRPAALATATGTYAIDVALATKALQQPIRSIPWEPNAPANERTNERTNGTDTPETAPNTPNERTQLNLPSGDKTALIRLLVQSGWNVTQIREVVRGEAQVIGQLVKAIKEERDT